MEIQVWLETLTSRHVAQLSDLGLFEFRSTKTTVGELINRYLQDYEDRQDITESTKIRTSTALDNRVRSLSNLQLLDLAPKRVSMRLNAEPVWSLEAKRIFNDFNAWQRKTYATATWSRDNKILRTVGKYAVENGYCDYNPFSLLPSESMVNEGRNTYVSEDLVLDAMDNCLDSDTRLTLALGRFAGLRTCSEFRTLQWGDVDFDSGHMTVLDSKKKTLRRMPLFDRVLSLIHI